MSSPRRKDRIRQAMLSVARETFEEQRRKPQFRCNRGDDDDDDDDKDENPTTATRRTKMTRTPPAVIVAAPISPTPMKLIHTMIDQLHLSPSSVLLDLGCGDGRWLITASLQSSCSCIGCDVDTERLEIAKEAIRQHGNLQERVQLVQQDAFQLIRHSFVLAQKVDVIVMYLFREAMQNMSRLLKTKFEPETQFMSRSEVAKEIHDDKDGDGNVDGRETVKIVCVGFALPSWSPPLWQCSVDGVRGYIYGAARRT